MRVSAYYLVGLKVSPDGTLFWTDKYETSFDESKYTEGQFNQSKSTYNQEETLAVTYFSQFLYLEVKSTSWVLCQYRPFDL